MPSQAADSGGEERERERGGGGSAEEWMPLRMRRARSVSVGSAGQLSSAGEGSSIAGADSTPNTSIHLARSRGSSISQAIPLEAAIKEEEVVAKLRAAKPKHHQQHQQEQHHLLSPSSSEEELRLQEPPPRRQTSNVAALVAQAAAVVTGGAGSPLKPQQHPRSSPQQQQQQQQHQPRPRLGSDGSKERGHRDDDDEGQEEDDDCRRGAQQQGGSDELDGPSLTYYRRDSGGGSSVATGRDVKDVEDEEEEDSDGWGGIDPRVGVAAAKPRTPQAARTTSMPPASFKRSNTFTIGRELVRNTGGGASGGNGGGGGSDDDGSDGDDGFGFGGGGGGRPVRRGGGEGGGGRGLGLGGKKPSRFRKGETVVTFQPLSYSKGHRDSSSSSSIGSSANPMRARLRSNSSTFSITEELHFDLDPDFDTSATHLMKLFAMMDKDGNGILTYDELYDSLLSMPGLQSIPRDKLDELFEKMDEDGNEGVTADEFVAMFQHIATKALARKGPGNLLDFMVYDYGPDQALCRRIYMKDPDCDDLDKTQVEYNLDEYFEQPIEDVKPGHVRWIAITGLEPSVVVRLANRYRLHPLQVEDVLTYHKQRMKTDKSNGALQLLVGRCVHSEYKGLPQIRKEQVTIFLLENFNTVITIQQTPSEVNRRLLARIMYAGSKLRLNGPRFLAYAVVDAIVDEIFPILRQIRKRLKALHGDVTSTSKRTSLKSIHLIQHIIREVNLLLLWLSPLGTVVSRLGAELLDPEHDDCDLKKHLEDLVDHVAALKEQTSSMIGWAKSLNDEYLNEQQYRMNEVIYILTMTTTLMLPAQFLTGVFGMNFEFFPLLNEPYGFPVFWVLTGAAMLCIVVFFKWKNWW